MYYNKYMFIKKLLKNTIKETLGFFCYNLYRKFTQTPGNRALIYHAFGSKYKGRALTDYADIVIYSFNGNKYVTSGGGGVLSTNNKTIYKKAKLLANNGKTNKKYDYKLFGHNYKITNLHAAVGIGQLVK